MARPRTWTDDDLRQAVERSSSMAEVVRALRLRRGGASYTTVRTRMEVLGVQLGGQPELPSSPAGSGIREGAPRRTWTEDDLRDAVAQARSLHDVFTRLGLVVGGSQWLVIRSMITQRGWSTDHWDRPLARQGVRRSDGFRGVLAAADLTAVVARCRSRADAIRALGFEPGTTTYRLLGEALCREGVSVDHFDSREVAMRRAERRRYRRPLEEILVRGSTYTSTRILKQRLVESGLLEPVCARCGIDSWNGEPITLHLDHVNGIRDDHRLENLRFLCPNCHSQTDTYCGRNQGAYGR